MTMILHPYCKVCGWRKGGIDSWNGKTCKCGLSESAISETIQMDRMWRDPEQRRRFESEVGLEPLAVNEEEMAIQSHFGVTQDYHIKFRTWAFAQITE